MISIYRRKHCFEIQHTLVATNVGVALVARQTSADGTVVHHIAISMLATVAGCHAAGVQAGCITGTFAVRSTTNTYWSLHWEGGGVK